MPLKIAAPSVVLALVTYLFVPSQAQAEQEQECPERSDQIEETRQLALDAFHAGQRLYNQLNYAGALRRFECSFSLYPHRDTLYNIGQCQASLVLYEQAIATFRNYLERFPDSPDIVAVNRRIQELEERLRVDPPPPDDQPVSPTQPNTTRTMAWVSLGLGGALSVAGIGLLAAGSARYNEFEDSRGNRTVSNSDLEDMRNTSRPLVISGWTLLAMGAAGLLSGLVLFLVSRPNEDSVSLSIHPMMAGNCGGLFLSGQF